MSRALSWVAVCGTSADDLHRQLGLRPTGRTAAAPEWPLAATAIGGGWTVVCARRKDRFVDCARLGPLSGAGELVVCLVEEHLQFSEAACWKDGAKQWSVTHDASRAIDHLQSAGELPATFHDIEASALEARRRDPDGPDLAFDVPVDLARNVVGFRYDGDGLVFEELEPLPPAAESAGSATPERLPAFARWLRSH